MKLKKIDIINFGHLSNLTFNLSNDNLSVFFGENEAGKSTTVAFIKQVMFGFYLRNNASPFFEDYKPLTHVSPMGGSLFFEDQGDEYQLERLWAKGDKTKKGILTVKKNSEVVPESEFFDKIHNIDGNFYADSFIFNQETLGQIAKLNQEDLLERIYYLGASNSRELIELRNSFEKEADNLFKKTGKKPEVNRLLKQIDDDQHDLTEIEHEFNQYKQVDKESQKLKKQLDQEKKQLEQLNKTKDHLLNLQKQLQNFTDLESLKKKQKNLDFDSNAYQKAQNLNYKISSLNTSIDSLQNQLAHLDSASDLNVEQAEKIVQKKPELLQWQADYKSCLQKEHELKSEVDQILALTPEVKKVALFDQDKIVQLKEDYHQWVKQEVPDKKPKSVVSQTIFYLGLPVFILGLGLLIHVPTAGWTLMAAGILMMGGAYYNLNQVVKQNKIVDQFQANVDKSQKNFEEKYGISPLGLDLNSLLGQLTQYQFKKRSEKNNQAQISEIKTRLDKVAVELQKILKEPVNTDFSDELNAITKVDTKLKNLQQKQQRKDEIQASLKTSSQKLMKLQLELKDILVQNKVRTLEEFDDLYQESLVQTKLDAQIVALENSLEGDLEDLIKFKPDELRSKLSEATTTVQEVKDKLDLLQASLAKVEVQKANLADSDAVFKAKQKLANTKTLFINASKEYLSNLMTAQLIQRTLDIASNERFPKMLQEAKEYLKLLTGGRYVDLVLDKKLKVVNQDGKKIEVKYLSRGTSEQLYFALKLAFIDQIKDQINLPILIDDSFVNFDDQRISYIKDLLEKIAENNQVLIFTAQKNLVDKLNRTPLTYKKGQKDA